MIKVESVDFDMENMQIVVNFSYDLAGGNVEKSSLAFPVDVEKEDIVKNIKKQVAMRRAEVKLTQLKRELENQNLEEVVK
ncbi:MAG: hypothetical protein ACKD6N_03565 [Candidatus Bathyarchaeota archaeon]